MLNHVFYLCILHFIDIAYKFKYQADYTMLRMFVFYLLKRAGGLHDPNQNIMAKVHFCQYSILSILLHICRNYSAGNPNKGIIQRGPFSKVNRLFWSEMKLNFNAVPSSTYFCSLLQNTLIKDQWELHVHFTYFSRLGGTSANVMHLYQQ